MRMPVLRYFIVVGSALFGLLLLVNNKTESNNSPVRTSQSVKMQPEPAPVLTAVNFAAEHEPAQAKPVESTKPPKAVEKKRKEKTASKYRPTWHRFVEYPFGTFSIR